MISEITKQIRNLSKSERYKTAVELLCTIPGISTLTAMIILTEIGDIHRFRTVDKLCSYIGLIPSEHSSGEKENRNYMTRRGKGILRRIIIEASWIAIRKDPGLLMNYTELTKRMKGNRAIKTISRKLIARIMFVLKNKEAYKFLATH
jgi:transposase